MKRYRVPGMLAKHVPPTRLQRLHRDHHRRTQQMLEARRLQTANIQKVEAPKVDVYSPGALMRLVGRRPKVG